MLDEKGKVLYVGKAKNLKKRVSSYFQRALDGKTQQLVSQIDSIQVTITRNEREALLLESNLIKAERPRYNIIFKDDKSYPYLRLTKGTYPQLSFYRGIRKPGAHYYGPYSSSNDAREALTLLQNIFQLRQCDDLFFRNRTRACLQYQIKRCSGPCVGHITEEAYQKRVKLARLFLEGHGQEVLQGLIEQMDKAANALEYERAAQLRDQIALLRNTQEQQIILKSTQDMDVLGFSILGEKACVHKLVIREGKMVGTRQFFPLGIGFLGTLDDSLCELAQHFLLQHYVHSEHPDRYPKLIVTSLKLAQQTDLSDLISEKAESSIQIVTATRGDRLRWAGMATTSAEQALITRQSKPHNLKQHAKALQSVLGLPEPIVTLDCFDVSHLSGEATKVSKVTFTDEGADKSQYRQFSITDHKPGDDYGALQEALMRHYTKVRSEDKALPDVLIVDGGKGQLNVAKAVLEELQIVDVVCLAVAKGPRRKPGLEVVYVARGEGAIRLNLDPLALQLIQQLRDEAHRFAVKSHRSRRSKRYKQSSLEGIPGIGSKRRLKLLKYFGGLEELKKANIEELAKVPGIHKTLAETIYQHLQGQHKG